MSAQTIDWSKYDTQAAPAANQIDWSKYEGTGTGNKDTAHQSFMQRAATQPSQFSYLNPLRYLDELGQGMAQGAEMIAHPVDTAKQIYKTAMAPHPMDFSDASDKPLLQQVKEGADTLAQSYGQAATLAAAGKVAAPVLTKGAGVVSDLAQGATDRAITAAKNVTPKQLAQVGGAGAMAVAGHGNPWLVYAGAKLGRIAEMVTGKEWANSPILKSPDLSLDDITDALADTIAQDRERFTAQQSKGLGLLPRTGAPSAAQSGEALADLPNPSQLEAEAQLRKVTVKPPVGNELNNLPATGAKPAAQTGEALGDIGKSTPDTPTGGKTASAPRFTVADRAAAKSLLQDALAQSTKDVVDQALPNVDATTKLRTRSQVDLALQQGDIAKAEAALKQANPAWTPKDRLPVPSTDEIRARIQTQNQTPKGFADLSEDNQILDSMRYDLNRHGWSAESEARREFIARNSTGMTKSELAQQAGMVGSEAKPVKLTKTPGVNTAAPGPSLNDSQVLMDQMQKTLDAIRQKKQQK